MLRSKAFLWEKMASVEAAVLQEAEEALALEDRQPRCLLPAVKVVGNVSPAAYIFENKNRGEARRQSPGNNGQELPR